MISPYDVAFAMFIGGWCPDDRDELVEEYGYSDDELDQIFPYLEELEVMEDVE